MGNWSWCDDLDTPELGFCTDIKWWDKNRDEVHLWFQNEGKGVGNVVSDHLIFVYPSQRTLFLLRFGP